jgi:hypothetical protein
MGADHESTVGDVSTLASLDAVPGAVTPGAEPVAIPVQVHNTSDIVQAYDLEPLGQLAAYIQIEPPILRLYPGTAGTASAVVVIPRSADVHAGEYPFGIKVTPTEAPNEAVTQEGMLTVLVFRDTTAELIPRTTRGRRGAIHDLAVDNRGNSPMRFVVSAEDAAQALRFEPRPQDFEVGPGEARFAAVSVKPVQTFWRGPARTHQFLVTVTPEDGAPTVLDGTHVQEARIPKWFWKALLALLALLLLLLALWYLLLRPTIESAAEDAVQEGVVAAMEAADTADQAADTADQAAGAAQQAAGSAEQSAAKAAEVVGEAAPTPSVVTVASSRRLEATVPRGQSRSYFFDLPAKATMAITDVVFENPQGDSGTISVAVDGQTKLRLALENFRSIDYHFVTPIEVPRGAAVTMTVSCTEPGQPAGASSPAANCADAVFVGGDITRPAS